MKYQALLLSCLIFLDFIMSFATILNGTSGVIIINYIMCLQAWSCFGASSRIYAFRMPFNRDYSYQFEVKTK